jgi:ribosomal protein S8
MENPKGGKPQYDSVRTLIMAVDKMNSDQERIESLLDMCETLENQRDVMRDFAQMQQSELRIAIEQLERSEAMVDEIQRQRQLEKEQYLTLQKGYTNQIDLLGIKFANLIKAVKEMRLAQKVYFDKRKKGHSVTMCLAELNHSQKLEKDIDDRLSYGENRLFTK